ncbi:MAG: delta-60 repeat domain-containing protein [Rhodanobacteraceae bacterium]
MNRHSLHTAVLGVALTCGTAQATDGVLDVHFGIQGVARAGVSDVQFSIASGTMIVQPDGKIVACGTRSMNGASGSDFFLARFTAEGALDTSFSFDGRVTIDFDAGMGADGCAAIALQDDGKLVAVGSTSNGGPFDRQFAIARLNPDGSLDTGFGAGTGKVRIPFMYSSGAAAVAIQADGRIVVAGTDVDGSTDYFTDAAVARLLPDGTLDTTFNLSGKLKFSFAVPGLTQDYACCVAIDALGRILVAGTVNDVPNAQFRMTVARLLPDGMLDGDFDADGRALIDFDFGAGAANAQAEATLLQHDGRIVVAGYANTSTTGTANYDMVAARLLQDGSFDAGFGDAGRTHVAFDVGGDRLDAATGIVEQGNGRLLLAGLASASTILYAATARLNRDGSLDDQFGTFGYGTRIYDFQLTAPSAQVFSAVALQGTQIIAAGVAHVPGGTSTYDLIAARLLNDLLFADGFE